jgi:hypothetical protein
MEKRSRKLRLASDTSDCADCTGRDDDGSAEEDSLSSGIENHACSKDEAIRVRPVADCHRPKRSFNFLDLAESSG